jgi:hypothetical protein
MGSAVASTRVTALKPGSSAHESRSHPASSCLFPHARGKVTWEAIRRDVHESLQEHVQQCQLEQVLDVGGFWNQLRSRAGA